ncbi:acyl-CoA dehydrogenase family protein [Nocardia terpenica]|uniref:acyl-CoA dehydrogenase family protein n=1 Tax=Nocardia terpenica TaxID=455432 RepID=UPI00155877F0|nr:acyl-CoA dehydrogenase family protein [Nocardia terpenica]NQE87874.1 acyl-CoA dehydrogenase family protein [Nocardia terpenica]
MTAGTSDVIESGEVGLVCGPRADELGAVVESVLARVPDPFALRRFPREVLAGLGEAGVLRRRWDAAAGTAGDMEYAVAMGDALSTRAPAGIAIGVSLHTETVLSLLHRFAGENEYLVELRKDALEGRKVGAIAASEPTGGSDLSAVTTLARPTAGGWVINGAKKYVSLGAVADFAVVLCRLATTDGSPTDRHATLVVPLDRAVRVREHDKLGTHALDTVAVEFREVEVGAEALLGRRGLGVLNLNYGLSFERLAIAAQVAGGCAAAIALAVEHAERRVQFGKRLRDHQYLSFRLAELSAEVEVLRCAVHDIARQVMTRPLDRELISRIAAVKLCAARAGERVISDAMQTFGGPGYLTNETPFGQFWNDIRVSRIGAGTDEMMLAIISDTLRGAPDMYDRLIRITQ